MAERVKPPFITANSDGSEWRRRVASLVNWIAARTPSEPVAVADLPADPIDGQRAMVSDASAPVFLATVAGGGLIVCPVFWNGSAWKVG